MTRQLTIDGREHEARRTERAGSIGKVERALLEHAWLTCGEIAALTKEPSQRVSQALNKLKHEGRAVAEGGLGARNRAVWASPESALTDAARDRLHELHKRRGLVAGEIDWRPTETIPEDYHAL